jgi:hypothetical protein
LTTIRSTRSSVPKRRGNRVYGGSRDHRAGPAGRVQKKNQQQAANGRACEVEKIRAVDALDGFVDRDRDNRPGQEKRDRCREVDRGQGPEIVAGPGKDKPKQQQDRHAGGQRERAQLLVDIPRPSRDDIRKHSAGAQPEQRDGDRQEREVIVKNHREYARKRKF